MLSQGISVMVGGKGLEAFSLRKTWCCWARPQHQLCVMLQPTELLPRQTSGPCQHGYLVQPTPLASYNCRARRSDLRARGADVQMMYFPFYTQPTTCRAALIEVKLPALT